MSTPPIHVYISPGDALFVPNIYADILFLFILWNVTKYPYCNCVTSNLPSTLKSLDRLRHQQEKLAISNVSHFTIIHFDRVISYLDLSLGEIKSNNVINTPLLIYTFFKAIHLIPIYMI